MTTYSSKFLWSDIIPKELSHNRTEFKMKTHTNTALTFQKKRTLKEKPANFKVMKNHAKKDKTKHTFSDRMAAEILRRTVIPVMEKNELKPKSTFMLPPVVAVKQDLNPKSAATSSTSHLTDHKAFKSIKNQKEGDGDKHIYSYRQKSSDRHKSGDRHTSSDRQKSSVRHKSINSDKRKSIEQAAPVIAKQVLNSKSAASRYDEDALNQTLAEVANFFSNMSPPPIATSEPAFMPPLPLINPKSTPTPPPVVALANFHEVPIMCSGGEVTHAPRKNLEEISDYLKKVGLNDLINLEWKSH